MKKPLLIAGLLLAFVAVISIFFLRKTEVQKIQEQYVKAQKEISSRAEYEEFLANHPFNNRKINLEEWENMPKADRPDLAWEQDYLATMNPVTRRPEREKLTLVMEMTKAMMLARPSGMPGGSGAGESWVERGPNNVGGRTRAMAWDPNTTNKVWAGGVTGGLWYNNDITLGGTWTKVDDFWDAIAVSSIAFDPNDGNTIYVGTGEGFGVGSSRGAGIWKSTNGGSTWAQLASTSSYYYVQDLVVNNESGASVVYAAVAGQYYSGIWNGEAAEGLQRSTDGGSTWTQVVPNVSGNPVVPADIEIAADGEIWVGTKNNVYGNGGGRVYSSTNGTTWTLDYTHSLQGRVELACAPTDANYVYAIFEVSSQVDAVIRTTNDGTSWATLSEPNDDDTGIPASDFSRNQAWYDLIIQVDPNDENVAITGGIDLFRTSDGGTIWNQLSHWYGGFGHPNVHADQHQIIFKPGSSTTAVFGNDGGVYYSSNLNSANPIFTAKNNGYNVTQFYACAIHPDSASNRFMAGSQDNGTQVYSSAGINATFDPIGGDGAYCHFLQTNGNYAIGSYVYNNYYHSSNSGTNFSNIGTDNSGSFINPSDFHDALAIQYSVKTNTTLKKITNINGTPAASDVTLPSSTGSKVTHIRSSEYTTATSTLFLGTSSGSLFKVENADGTPTMTNISGGSFPSGSISCVDLGSNENELIVTFSNYGVNSVWYATDGGTSWASKEGDLPDIPVRWALMNPHSNQEVILATEVGVWGTTNFQSASPNWIASNTGLANVRVDMFKHRSSDDVIIAATHGRGLFSSGFEPVCPAPSALTATSITETTASLGWTEALTATTWDIEWGASGFTPTGTPTITGTTTNPHNLTGLTGTTTYDFYVRANCGGGDLSKWSAPYRFTTNCSTLVAPITETFSSSSAPTCWSQSASSGGPWVFGTPGGFTWNTLGCADVPTDHTSGGGTNYAAVDFSGNNDAAVVLEMVDVDVSALTTPYLSFYYYMCNSSPNSLFVESWDGSSWNSVVSNTTGTSGWEEIAISLTPHTYGSSLVRLRFRAEPSASTVFYGDAAIDDVSIVEMPTNNWTGAVNTDWATAGNWATGVVPTASTDVVIPNVPVKLTISTGTTAVANNITIEASSSLIIAAGGTLTSEGNITQNGTFIINSDATLNGSLIVKGTATGAVNYQRHVSTAATAEKGWYLLSAPVNGTSIANFYESVVQSGTKRGIAPYVNTNAATFRWAHYTTADTPGNFVKGKGYAIKKLTAGELAFNGALNTDNAGVSISLEATGDQYNAIGNPYTSYINSGTFLDNIVSGRLTEKTIWLWDESGNLGAGEYITKNITDAYKIAPGQGFFVKALANGDVIFPEAIQTHEGGDSFLKQESRPEIKLSMSDGTNLKSTKILYIENKTTGFDDGFDSSMFEGASNPFAVYTQLVAENENKNIAIQTLPDSNYESMSIPIGVKAGSGLEITFTVDALNLPTDINVFLEDRVANTITRLDEENTVYRVTLTEALNGVGRFFLHTSSQILAVSNVDLVSVSIYSSDKKIHLSGLPNGVSKITLYNVLGKVVLKESTAKNRTSIPVKNLSKGAVYIVKLITEKGVMSKKIIIE